MKSETHFKGWAKPGPVPPGLGAPVSDPARFETHLHHAKSETNVPLKIESHETLDAISGHFRLFQLDDGHRFSTDDILTAWYGTTWCPTARHVLDLGSGIGTVGMICAWRLPGAKFVTVEAQAESVALARKSARYNGLEDRYEIREGDFRSERGQPCCSVENIVLPGSTPGIQAPDSLAPVGERVGVRGPLSLWSKVSTRQQPCPRDPDSGNKPTDQAGPSVPQSVPILHSDEKFDLITGSPPYFPPESGVKSEHPQKLACRFELRGTIADYCATAAKHLAPGGLFACVFPHEPAQLARVEAAAKDSSLVIIRKRPVVFREGDPALVGLFGMMRAEDLPEWFRGQTWTEPDLVIRTRDGKIHPEYSAVKLAIGFPP